ncbi:MAG: hypothetical protein AAGF66_08860 [Cyanobacteria bacterium P01_H01_bin.119]
MPKQPATQLFLATLVVTAIVWFLKGLSLFSFMPGIIFWLLLLLCFGTGIFTSLQRMR